MKPKGTNSPGRFEFFGARSCASWKVMALRMAQGMRGTKQPAAMNATIRIISRHCFDNCFDHWPPRRKYPASTRHEVISKLHVYPTFSTNNRTETPPHRATFH